MKIRNIKRKIEGAALIISAKCQIRLFGEDEIYFKVDRKYRDFLVADASPFAAALLLPSMKKGEDLIIDGSISKALYDGMHKIMEVFLGWNIGLKRIKIKAKTIVPDSQEPLYNASLFSGGVDSFYTYLKNKKEGNKMDYFILIDGYDIELENTELWQQTRETIEKIAKKEEVDLITVESNLYRFLDPILTWDYICGACLSAVGLVLRNKIKKVYFPSSYTPDQLFPAGSHPLTDPLWGTEKLSIIHDGGETSRFDKTQFIAKNPLVLKYLRVCYLNEKGIYNCGRCDKCLRTMIGLKIAGTLSQSETFPRKIDNEVVRNLHISAEYSAIFQRENLKALEKAGNDPDLEDALRESLQNVPKLEAAQSGSLEIKILYFDHVYLRGTVRKLIRVFRQ